MGRARQHERAHRTLPRLDEARGRVVCAELAGGEPDQVEPADQALERDVDPHEARERQPGVGMGLAEGEPRDDLDLDRERLRPHREHAVLLIEAERGARCAGAVQRQQPLAAEVELQARLLRRPGGGEAHLGMRQAPHAVPGRPRSPERHGLAVEPPVAELHPVAHEPGAQLVSAGGEPVQPLVDAQRHATSGTRTAGLRSHAYW